MTRNEKIRILLKKRKMKPGDLTKATGLSRSTMCRVMKDDHVLSEDTLQKIASALNVSPEYLRGGYILPDHLTEEDIIFMACLENVPYLKLVKEIADKGIVPEDLGNLIKILSETTKQRARE